MSSNLTLMRRKIKKEIEIKTKRNYCLGVVRGRVVHAIASGACNYRHVDQVSPPQNIEVTMYTTNSNNSPTTKYIRMLRQNRVLASVRDV